MLKTNGILAAALSAALLGGCASSGMGGGDILRPGQSPDPVMFSWQSRDGSIDGTMTASTADATYQGRFMQVTQQTVTDALAPMWDIWPMGWSDWPYDGWAPPLASVEQFATVYSGKVIANLKNAEGRPMRCRLQLVQPEMGMAGGGDGQCQIAGGPSFHASF